MGLASSRDAFTPSTRFVQTEERCRDEAPRVPVIGLDAGCIPGTKPGCSARELERAGRDIVRSRMTLARQKLKQGREPTR